MTLTHYLRTIVRESRGSRRRLLFFVACLAIGVAAVVTVAGLAASLDEGIRGEARGLLGADIAIEGRRELPPELDGIVARAADANGRGLTVERTSLRELATIVAAPPAPDGTAGASVLAELKVVDGRYPFYGKLRLDPDPGAAGLSRLLTPDTAIVAPALLSQLRLNVGDGLSVGGQRFRIAAAVLDEPDKLNFSLAFGPRVYLAAEGLARTPLAGRGSRVRHVALLKLPDAADAHDAKAIAEAIKAALPDPTYYEVETFAEAQPALRAGLRRIGHFLGLVGLLSLLIGGVGVAQTVRAWVAARLDAIAILKCLGVTPREVLTLYAGQTVLMALVGSAVGAAAGALAVWLTPTIIRDLVPGDLVRPWQPLAMLRGVALGVGVALVFSLPPLLSVRRVPPARVFRKDSEPLPAGWPVRALLAIALVGGVWLAAYWQGGGAGRGVRYATYFTAGLAAVVVALAAAAAGMVKLVGRLPRDAGGLVLRHGVSSLARPGASTVGAVVALGVGVLIMLTMHLVERHLTLELGGDLPADAPSAFLMDIQPDQWPGVERTLREHGAENVKSVPIVTARLAAVDGVPVSELGQREAASGGGRGRQRWVLTREQRLTYLAELPRGNTITSGTLWSDPSAAEISIEEGFAKDLGVAVGSAITLDVQGVEAPLRVTSLRSIDWRTFGINFFLVVEPGVLEDTPQMRIATAQFPEGANGAQAVQDALAAEFPNVTVVQIREVLAKVRAVLNRLTLAVQLLGGFTVAAGIVILAGAIFASYARRGRDVALYKTLGMTRRQVMAMYAVEYAMIGAVAAVIGVAGGTGLAWGVLTRLMEIPWRFRGPDTAAALAATVALVIAAGLAVSARALASRPAEVLRNE